MPHGGTRGYQVILLFDGDDAGRAATDDCIKRLARRIFARAVELPEGKQPDMLTANELQLVLKGGG
jgi:DNA primase